MLNDIMLFRSLTLCRPISQLTINMMIDDDIVKIRKEIRKNKLL